MPTVRYLSATWTGYVPPVPSPLHAGESHHWVLRNLFGQRDVINVTAHPLSIADNECTLVVEDVGIFAGFYGEQVRWTIRNEGPDFALSYRMDISFIRE
jgi:hypothetical protein